MKFLSGLCLLFAGSISLAQTPIDEEQAVLIGGIRQYMTIRGDDNSLPLLLFLHGGPGGSVMHYADKFTQKLQRHFVVIQWDQRETGKTLGLNPSPVPLTLSLFQTDTREVIQSLLSRFKRPKLYLAAHSWGTALGFHIAGQYPELLYAYIPIGAMIDQLESERIALRMMREKALKNNNQTELKELALVNVPFATGEQLYYHRKWLIDLTGGHKKLSRAFVENWAATWLRLFNEASKENLFESRPAIGCPVYFFAGRKDYQTNSSIVERYYSEVVAARKSLLWFESSGHSIPSSEPDRMQQLIIEKILPETFTIRKAKALAGQSAAHEQ
jgi:pimeloyl-ACP methyl ester carboxylesterase